MTYAPHTLVTFGGTLRSTGAVADQDMWQCGVRVAAGSAGSLTGPMPDAAAYAAAVGPTIKAWYTGASNRAQSDVSLDFVKVAQIGADGKYAPGTSAVVYSTGLPLTGTIGRVGPPFLACCVSWTTALGRGAGHAGRVYLPFAGFTGFSSSRITSTEQNVYLTWGKNLLVALAVAAGGATAVPVVASKKTAGLQAITGVRVDDVVDVQRRRKNKLKGAYVTATFP